MRLPPADLLQGLTDEQLADLVTQGYDPAFEVLVERHRPGLVRHCSQLVGRADAEESVQEALLRAYLALSRGHPIRRVRPWLWTIAHNTALNQIRTRGARPTTSESDACHSHPAGDAFERREDLRLVVEALGALPERQREALVMRELEGRSYAEIESRLHTSNGAVRQLLNRARCALRARLGALATLEPAFRWITGNGSMGSGVVRLGALSGGCAVTIKVCATALVPATLAAGALSEPSPPRAASRPQTAQRHAARPVVAHQQPAPISTSTRRVVYSALASPRTAVPSGRAMLSHAVVTRPPEAGAWSRSRARQRTWFDPGGRNRGPGPEMASDRYRHSSGTNGPEPGQAGATSGPEKAFPPDGSASSDSRPAEEGSGTPTGPASGAP